MRGSNVARGGLLKTEAITFLKEDVLALGQLVTRSVEEVTHLLRSEPAGDLAFIEEQEEVINDACQSVEEHCLDLLLDRETFDAREIRMLLCSTIIAAKFERIADHANRVGRMATWASEDSIAIPPELPEMVGAVHRMLQDVLLAFVAEDPLKAQEILQRDSQVDYLHDVLSQRLLSDLGKQDHADAQMRAQFLFCARFIERMGDACVSIAKRVYFIATGNRLRRDPAEVNP
jgi:phosphate transport system protein